MTSERAKTVGRPEDDAAAVNYLEVQRLRALLRDMEVAKNEYATLAFQRGQEIERLKTAIRYWQRDSAAAWDKCEERRLQGERLRKHRCPQLPVVGSFP